MPQPPVRKEIAPGLEAELISDFDRFSDGRILMTLATTDLPVLKRKKQKGKWVEEQVGRIGIAMGGALYVDFGQRCWVIDREQLFRLVLAADQQREQELTAAAKKPSTSKS